MSKGMLVGAAVAAVCVVYAAATATVVPEGQEATLTGEVAFNPEAVANDFWEKQAKEYFPKNAVDIKTLFTEASGDLSLVAKKYGHYSMGDQGELSFIVSGTGVVKEVKDKLKAGYLLIEPEGYKGDETFRLQIGTVYKGSAVRDTINTISFKDFENQIQWAQVSVALHNHIQKEVVDPVNPKSLAGKTVKFVGCFTEGAVKTTIAITPVSLEVMN
ncbi:MAG: DUF2291 domain-containing protein [Succinivibrionaceae bacterium]|nr:DUF2291 domain-containing protein [Succinivibrionaceae bacterium]